MSPAVTRTGKGPGQAEVPPWGIVCVAAYLVLVALLLLRGLIGLWPGGAFPEGEGSGRATASPAAAAKADSAPQDAPVPEIARGVVGASAAPEGMRPTVTPAPAQAAADSPQSGLPDARLLLMVVLAGALGGVLHALRSLYWYVGNRNLRLSWVLMYLLLPFVGGILALLFYLVLRGSLLTVEARPTGFVGFLAVAGLTGLFSQQAAVKLKEIAERFFAPAAAGSDTTPQEAGPATATPSIGAVVPAAPAASQNPQTLTITGTGFTFPAAVALTPPSGRPAVTIAPALVRNPTPTSLAVEVTLDAPGDWQLTVAGGDGQQSQPYRFSVK